MTRTWWQSVGTGTLIVVLAAAPTPAQEIRAETWNVRFPTSASGRAQDHFLSGLTALHLFMYEDAVEHFRAAQREAPGFAMAYWGEALAHYRPIWSIYNRDDARAILNRLAKTAEARAAKAPTPREKAYLAAVEVLFADGSQRERQIAYAAEMQRVADRYPDDLEALALLCVARVMIFPRDTNGRDRMETVAMALEILERNPLHPGAPRYLIQSADDPEHAALGLSAVRAMKRWKEEGGAESIHIPSHVYVQLGMWDEAERVNARAFDVSMAWTKAHGFGLADLNMHNYEHLLRWRQYSLLQLGREKESQALIDRAAADFRASGKAEPIGTALYRLRAQFMVETGRWELVKDLARDAKADGYDSNPFLLQAIGLGAARTGDHALARNMAARLQANRAWRSQAEHHQVLGLVALAEGDQAGALSHLAEAVAIDERNIRSHGLGAPDPSKPVWELYGEVLLAHDRPKEALAQFQRTLDIYRRRPSSLLGAARASLKLGDRQKADRYAQELLAIWRQADSGHAGLAEIRRVTSN
jgi:hypothetical protein